MAHVRIASDQGTEQPRRALLRMLLFGSLLGILSLAPLAPKVHAEPVDLDALPLEYLGPQLEILTTANADTTLHDVREGPLRKEFERPDKVIPSYGVTQPVVWARFTLSNRAEIPRAAIFVFEYAVADSVELYHPKPGSGSEADDRVSFAGDAVFDSQDVVAYKQPAFRLTVPPASEATYFVRVETTASQTLPISLETEGSFSDRAQREQLLFGLLFGAIGLFIVYTASLGALLRSTAAGWFSLYMISFAALLAIREGYLREWLGDAGVPYNTSLNLISVGLLFFFGAKLLREFLNVRRISRRDDLILKGLQYGALAWIPLAIAGTPLSGLVGLPVMGLGPIFSTTLAFRYWLRGAPNARYFAVGWAFAHANAVIDFGYIVGLIGYEPFMLGLMPISLAIATTFFAIALIEQAYDYQVFARIDPMTGLANRRHFAQHFDLERCALEQSNEPLSLIMIDVDEFKRFNDHYGHSAGDRALMALAPILTRNTRRRGDLAARYGGEEFVAILSRTNAENAQRMAEQIRADVEGLAIPHEGSAVGDVVTVSLGVATAIPRKGDNAADLLDHADVALYRAKELGRNRVAVAAPPDLTAEVDKPDEDASARI